MPIYCYECEACGAVQEDFLPRARPAESLACRSCGGTARRSYAAESPGASRGPAGGGRIAACERLAACGEIRSVAAGVMPEQAEGAQRALEARGVDGVRFDRRTGDAVFRDRTTRLRALKVMGLHDKDEIRG
jgi:putative FmdB family regulatory protein